LNDILFPPAEKIRARALSEARRMLEHYLLAHEESEAMIGMYEKRIARLEAQHKREA
jgi:hypothetical protein